MILPVAINYFRKRAHHKYLTGVGPNNTYASDPLDITSSNVNEVIRVILNFSIFFAKRYYTQNKHKKHISEQKLKNALKKHLRGK